MWNSEIKLLVFSIKNHEVGKFRIVLKNDEDIEKWREDRRK